MARWSIESKNWDHGDPKYDKGRGPTTVLAIVEAESRHKAIAQYNGTGFGGGLVVRKLRDNERSEP